MILFNHYVLLNILIINMSFVADDEEIYEKYNEI